MRPFALFLVALALSASAMAQTSWRAMPEGAVVSLDTRTAVGDYTFDGTSNGTAASTLLSARVPLGGRWSLQGELPLAITRHTPDIGDSEYASYGTALAAGAPYLGAEVELAKALTLEAGLRFPAPYLGLSSYIHKPQPGEDRAATLRSPDGLGGGIVTEPHRFEVYGSYNSGTLVAAVRMERKLTDRIHARFRVAPTGDPFPPRPTVLVGYSAQADADLGLTDLSIGLVGQRVVTGRVSSIWEPSKLPSILAQVSRTLGSVRPGLIAVIPLEKQHRLFPDAVVGFNLDVPLR